MASVVWHLVPEITRHLTITESRFLVSRHLVHKRDIKWNELILSLSLCQYAIKRLGLTGLTESFFDSVLKTAPPEFFILPVITHHFKTDNVWRETAIKRVINLHRPIPILAFMFKTYGCSRFTFGASNYCDYAAGANNVKALAWLRDPNTSDGTYPWTKWTCLMATTCGHFGMLQRLRDPDLDGGVCPWNKAYCLQRARFEDHTEIMKWIEAQPDDD